mgnify:CR=1 FL=1
MSINAIIEIPYNTFIKYEYDEKHKRIRCDRILNTSMLYPGNYGYIPNTLAKDGDPLDILVVCNYPLYPGTIIEVKILGILIMTDEKGLDEKIIAVPSNNVDYNFNLINDLNDLSPILITKIKHFFEHYKDNEKEKWNKVDKYENKQYALNIIEKYKIIN